MRHKHVGIGIEERDQWLLCMRAAVESLSMEPEVFALMSEKIESMADHMRNRQGDGDPIADCKD